MHSVFRESIRRMQSTSMRSGDSRSLKRHDRQFFRYGMCSNNYMSIGDEEIA